jgi:hypothetical protein
MIGRALRKVMAAQTASAAPALPRETATRMSSAVWPERSRRSARLGQGRARRKTTTGRGCSSTRRAAWRGVQPLSSVVRREEGAAARRDEGPRDGEVGLLARDGEAGGASWRGGGGRGAPMASTLCTVCHNIGGGPPPPVEALLLPPPSSSPGAPRVPSRKEEGVDDRVAPLLARRVEAGEAVAVGLDS